MSRNDRLLLGTLIATFVTLFLVALAPSVASSSDIVSHLWSFANSTFFVALITACAGAFAGAYGAQFIANRNARRQSLLREVNAYNVAISTCFDIANVYLDFKRQVIRPVCDRYFCERKQVASAIRSGQQGRTTHLSIKCETRPIDRQFSPIESLRCSMEERIASEGPALAFLTMLSRAISTLGGALDSREAFLRQMSQVWPHKHDELFERYFAIRDNDEISEGTFPECIRTFRS